MMMTNPRTDDVTLRRYLRDLGTSTPLTPDAELELGRQMRQARRDLLEVFNAIPARHRNRILGDLEDGDLTLYVAFEKIDATVSRLVDAAANLIDEQLLRLAHRALTLRNELHEIRSTFIKRNLRLVVHLAKRFTRSGVPILDLVQEGNLGLMRAVDRFDPDRGTRFSTCAVVWILQSLSRESPAIGQVVRLPEYQARRRTRLTRTIGILSQALGRRPNMAEIATHAGIDEDKVADALSRVSELVGLEQPLDDDEGPTILDTVPDQSAFADALVGRELSEQMRAAFVTLSPREREVLSLRYGLKDEQPLRLREIGERMGICKERVRQIEAEALKTIRRRMEARSGGKRLPVKRHATI